MQTSAKLRSYRLMAHEQDPINPFQQGQEVYYKHTVIQKKGVYIFFPTTQATHAGIVADTHILLFLIIRESV